MAVGSACRNDRTGRIDFRWGAGGDTEKGISGALAGTEASLPPLARATGAAGVSAPPFGGTGIGRGGAGRPAGGAATGGAIRPPTEGAPDATGGATVAPGAAGRGFSIGRSLGAFVAAGALTGPVAAGGPTGGRGGSGGDGGMTALRAAALISAIERVSGWRSGLSSCSFFRSSMGCACGGSMAGAGGSGAVGISSTFSAGPLSARKCDRILSARSSSSALEWDRFSWMPISTKYSRIKLLFTSSSRASSLTLIFPMLSSFSPLRLPNLAMAKICRPVLAKLQQPYFILLHLSHLARRVSPRFPAPARPKAQFSRGPGPARPAQKPPRVAGRCLRPLLRLTPPSP